ncbi:serine/threonine kinase 32 [Entomortierella parvispora]|uniref:non-specific serine/threonine protein kinase n=1 Tax=Entomortierella parvispora TaxID=205924 RepID=A0A9P3LTK2_9FUNG|nr:serine/threonine kinase 32 [Entomortierella parvispora]
MGNGSSRDQEGVFANEVNLFQFKLLRVIGGGSFGKVRMVERRETGKLYALKYISKAQVIQMEAVKNILRERQILESLDHAFVVNMRFAFQDDEYMYMCMDLMMGGDLRFHLNRRTFDETTVQVWIAEIASAVSHLHSLGIVHRDIKPDNVLLDENGHAHLTDFNIGCKLTPDRPFLTSQSGTVAYMAPEVFKGTGYGTSVDWWALGVVFYECIYNQRPFTSENIADLKRDIVHRSIEYPPQEGISRECISAIQGFLTRDPTERLGIHGGMQGIQLHACFEFAALRARMNLQQWWHMLELKQLSPGFKPPADDANFDISFDLEELLMEDEPLTYRSTRQRAQRMLKEKDRAMKEENERRKTEENAAIAEAAAAQRAMEAMNQEIEESMKRIRASNASSVAGRRSPALLKKKSGLWPMIDQKPPTPVQTTPLSTKPSNPDLARQTQFQSIPLSPIDPGAHHELPVSMTFPSDMTTGPHGVDWRTLATVNPQSPACNHPATSLLPTMAIPPAEDMRPGERIALADNNIHEIRKAASARIEGNLRGMVRCQVLSKGINDDNGMQPSPVSPEQARSPPTSGTKGPKQGLFQPPQQHLQDEQLDQQQQQDPLQATQPQMAITSPVIIPIPQDHSVSRQKIIPQQKPHAQPPRLRHQISKPTMAAMHPLAVNIEAAAALTNLSDKDRFLAQLEMIDREFKTFDYTVYESYNGLVDPVTMSVGDPPDWVKSRDEDGNTK